METKVQSTLKKKKLFFDQRCDTQRVKSLKQTNTEILHTKKKSTRLLPFTLKCVVLVLRCQRERQTNREREKNQTVIVAYTTLSVLYGLYVHVTV